LIPLVANPRGQETIFVTRLTAVRRTISSSWNMYISHRLASQEGFRHVLKDTH
jgi:hypothetical protein